jgi:hypothetical protein
MQPIWGNVAALAVALIFYTYRGFMNIQARKKRILCERVAFMLWTVAERVEANEPMTADVV